MIKLKNFFLLILVFAFATIWADNYKLLLSSKDGRTFAMDIENIDSIYFCKGSVDNSFISIGKHDTCFITIKDTIEVHDTLVQKVCTSVVSDDKWSLNIENPVVSDYMNEVDYTGDEDSYSYSNVNSFRLRETEWRKDQPRGYNISWTQPGDNQYVLLSRKPDFSAIDDSIKIADDTNEISVFNLLPKETYYYKVYSGGSVVCQSHFSTIGQVRMLMLPSLRNMRDIGGWKTDDGRQIKYGLLYRGGEMNTSYNPQTAGLNHSISSEDSAYMYDRMKIRLEMDLRDGWDLQAYRYKNKNVLGGEVEYYNERVLYVTEDFLKEGYDYNQKWGRTIKKILKYVSNGRSVFFHCTWGADRTGLLALLIEGVCGVSESDISKDFELTSMYVEKPRTSSPFRENIIALKEMGNGSLKQGIEAYLINAGVTKNEIDLLRESLLK